MNNTQIQAPLNDTNENSVDTKAKPHNKVLKKKKKTKIKKYTNENNIITTSVAKRSIQLGHHVVQPVPQFLKMQKLENHIREGNTARTK